MSIPEDVLKRVLHSLACGKFKVLKRIPQATGGAADSGTPLMILFLIGGLYVFMRACVRAS